jgi:hypothetical protein
LPNVLWRRLDSGEFGNPPSKKEDFESKRLDKEISEVYTIIKYTMSQFADEEYPIEYKKIIIYRFRKN